MPDEPTPERVASPEPPAAPTLPETVATHEGLLADLETRLKDLEDRLYGGHILRK